MKIKVLFFANFKEILNCNSLECDLNQNQSVADLCFLLAEKGQHWAEIFESPSTKVKIAVNQEMATLSTLLTDKDEVAFFPPVTGG